MNEVLVRDAADPRAAAGERSSRHTPVYAALDLGTNNCRLLVAKAAARGYQVIDSFSRTTRLGEGLSESGTLSVAAVRRTLSALRHCAHRLECHQVSRLRAVATEACRQAANRETFLTRVRHDTGIAMRIISAEEEARLAVAGCRALIDRRCDDVLVFDIGGGSTELIHVRRQPDGALAIARLYSIPIGVVTLAERHDGALTGAGYGDTVAEVAGLMAPFDPDLSLGRMAAEGHLQMLGTSGTVTTLAGIHLGLPRYDRSRVDGSMLTFADIATVTRRLIGGDLSSRAGHPCVGRDRADLVVGGCAILEAICARWPVGRLRVADRGVREGLLLSMLDEDGAPS